MKFKSQKLLSQITGSTYIIQHKTEIQTENDNYDDYERLIYF